MARTDCEMSLIEAVEAFLVDSSHQASELKCLVGKNAELEGKLFEMTADIERLRSDALIRNAQVCALIEETTASSKFQIEFMSIVGREFSSEAKVVEMKYQVRAVELPIP